MTQVRSYQQLALHKIHQRWAQGSRSVVLVAPTGSGKTHMGAQAALGFDRVLWVAHRRELVKQARAKLAETIGGENVGVVMPGFAPNESARVQVGTVQTLLERKLPAADLLVLDEAHHYVTDSWRAIASAYSAARTLGLTATPERADGSPLGDIFDSLEVAASYSELVKLGYLVPWNIYQPSRRLGHNLAMTVQSAYRRFGGGQAFSFHMRVADAEAEAERFRALGVRWQCIGYHVSRAVRDAAMDGFRAGDVRGLSNVFALTEGVDVPTASEVYLARQFASVADYIQACGRAGRASPGKSRAILIDLCGSSHRHGSPIKDRTYSLHGKPISTGSAVAADEREVERGEIVQHVVGEELVLAPFSADGAGVAGGEQPEFMPRRRAERVERKLESVAARSGYGVAKALRGAYGGFGE